MFNVTIKTNKTDLFTVDIKTFIHDIQKYEIYNYCLRTKSGITLSV
jgi:hypothetical protein